MRLVTCALLASLVALVPAVGAAEVDDARLLNAANDKANWLTYGRDYGNQRFSPLKSIDATNVKKLAPSWIYQSGVASTFQATPIVADGVMFVSLPFNHVVALEAATGRELWRYEHKRRTQKMCCGPANRGVAVAYGKVFMGTVDARLIALDAKTGAEKWRFARTSDSKNKFSFSTPTVITVNGEQQLITPGSGVVNALDPKTGQEIWQVRYGDGYSVIPKPVFGHGLLFIATGYNAPTVIAIRPAGAKGDVTDTHVVWTTTKKAIAPHTPSLLLVGDELYMVSDKGIATCLDARTGRENWSERIGGNYSSSPLFADGKIYLQTEEGPAS
jgi:glucose dehydrogenase